jgi:hypothetical protein
MNFQKNQINYEILDHKVGKFTDHFLSYLRKTF